MPPPTLPPELDEEDRFFIAERFHEQMVGKLNKYHARIGAISCSFAGERYRNWILHFREKGPGYEIDSFEYDEDARGLNLK